MALTELTKVTGPGIHTLSNVLSHNIKSSGIITATKFSGPLDSIGGNFAGVITATNGVFSGNISAVDGNFSGNVTIGGTLTYEDVTNIDSVGIITARDGLKVLGGGANIVGVVTATSADINGDLDVDGHSELDNVNIAGIVTVSSEGINAGILDLKTGNNIRLRFSSGGTAQFRGDTNPIASFDRGSANSTNVKWSYLGADRGLVSSISNEFRLTASGSIPMTFYANSAERLRIETSGAVHTGISTFQDIDVDGHTNLDNVSIAGITTFSGQGIRIENATNPFIHLKDTTNNTDSYLSTDDAGSLYLKADDNQEGSSTKIVFQLDGSEKVHITSGGSVNIGGDYSQTSQKLKVTGNTTIDGTLTAGVGFVCAGGFSIFSGNVTQHGYTFHDADSNTYFGFPSADQFDIFTAGSSRMHINSDGRFRVGCTAQPSGTVGGFQLDMGSYPGTARLMSGAGASGTETASLAIGGSNYHANLHNGANAGGKLDLYNYNSTDGNSTAVSFHNSNGLSIARILGVNISHSSRNGALVFMTSTANYPTEKVRIDSSGRMGLGTIAPDGYDNEAENLVVASSNHTGITIASTGSNKRTNLYFADGTSGNEAYRGAITYDHDGDYMMMRTSGAERLRITSTGRIRLGGDVAGTTVSDLDVTRGNSTITDVMLVKGNTGNGFIRFQDNDSSCNFTLGADDGSALGSGSFILYDRAAGAYRWGIDGSGNMRVWDGDIKIHTSGHGIDFSSTGNSSGSMSNELFDDYEEGSWTPALPSGGTATSLVGQYTKIGNKVFWSAQIQGLGGSSAFSLSGLPYFVDAGWGGGISISDNNHSPEEIYVFAHVSSSDIYFRSDQNVTYNVSTFSGHFFYINGFYQTNS